TIALLFSASLMAASCLHQDDDYVDLRPTALVTVYPTSENSFKMQLDENTVLIPNNVKASPYKDKVVRALVNYEEIGKIAEDTLEVKLNWMDSIRTKKPLILDSDTKLELYENDPVEIVRDWVTIAEDGFLTLRVRTLWGPNYRPHTLNLIGGLNPENPYEFVLRHDANGDYAMEYADALIAFDLNDIPHEEDEITLTLKWKSFSGEKQTTFSLLMHKD
ncbi:MAG: NigD-like protein, partial [Candidatus Cryptobacteroides sp.]